MYIRRSLLHFFILLVTLLALAPAIAVADGNSSEEVVDRAAQYYQEARQAYGDGHFARAAELLERAYAHERNLVYKYNQILAYQGLGDYGEALRILDIYGDPLRDDGRFDDIDELAEELEEAQAARQAREAALADGDGDDENGDDNGDDPVEPPPLPDDGPNMLAWSLVGGGGALFAGGLLLSSGLLISSTVERLEGSRTAEEAAQVYGNGTYNRDDDLSTLRTHQTMSIIFLAGGVVLGGTGIGLMLLDGGSDTAGAQSGSLQFQPLLGLDVAGASLSGRF